MAEAILATMYSNDNMGLSAKQADEQVSNYERRVANTTLSDAYMSLPGDDNAFIDRHVSKILGSSALKNGFRGSTKLSEAEGYDIMVGESASEYVNGMSGEEQQDIVRNANVPYYEIRNRALLNAEDEHPGEEGYEPTDADLANAAMQLELDRRVLAHTTDYQNISEKEKRARARRASAIINGKVDLDKEWIQVKYGADIKRLNRQIAQLKKLYDRPEADRQYIKDRMGDYQKQLDWINSLDEKMPALVKRRVMQNAFNNVSRRTQNNALRAGGDILKYAPASRVASFMRHTSPSSKDLQGMTPEKRREAILNHKMEHLNRLLKMNKTAFASAVYSGAISPADSMAWVNKHPMKNFVGKDGKVSPLMRSVAFYLRQNTIQGNPGIDPETGKPRFVVLEQTHKLNPDGTLYRTKGGKTVNAYPRNSEHEIKRKAANRKAYSDYMHKQMRKYSDRSNFLDENGKYSPERHAEALMRLTYGDGNGDNGYLPASAYVISHAHDIAKDNKGNTYQKIPDKTMELFLDMVRRHRETHGESFGHSRWTDDMRRYDDMIDSVYRHVYVTPSKSATSMAQHRAAVRNA